MIETVAAVNLMVEEVMKIKKNRLMPDFPTGNEKRIAIVTGIFGDELQGQYGCYELIRRIKEDFASLTGIVDIYPALNPLGMEARTREIPGPELEMNGLFPGSNSGVMGEYAAYCVFEDLRGADFCLDVHGSNMFLHEILQIRMNDDRVEELLPYARALNTDMIWIHPSNQVKRGSLAYELNQIGMVRICSRALGNLKDHGTLKFSGRLGYTLNDLHVVYIESSDCISAVVSLLKHFSSCY